MVGTYLEKKDAGGPVKKYRLEIGRSLLKNSNDEFLKGRNTFFCC